jgi:ectoine hydroxylase-related dioxygenase (phytanoyl-CoA dioxygenase family)
VFVVVTGATALGSVITRHYSTFLRRPEPYSGSRAKFYSFVQSLRNKRSTLSDQQQQCWQEQGYLLLPQVLSPADATFFLDKVDGVLAACDKTQLFSQQSAAGSGAVDEASTFKLANAITQTDALDSLIDHPSIFPWLLTFLGPYLQILGTEIFVRRPGPSMEPLVEWHVDGGPALSRFLPCPGNPLLQMKVQFFLTDISDLDSGNFMFVPGSHRRLFAEQTLSPPDGAIQLRARAGDVLLFPWSLWHAVAPNRSAVARKSITFRYGPMWSRPYDYDRLPADVLARMTPRRRRLFGDLGEGAHPSSYFYPDPDEQLRLMLDQQ